MMKNCLKCLQLLLFISFSYAPSLAQREIPANADMSKIQINELVKSAREIRERIWKDPHRPTYHQMPPEGFFNDANGSLFWNGRYHNFYLGRTTIPHPDKPQEEIWVAVWDHVSSHDLIHWIHHPPAVRPKLDGSQPKGIYSGGAIKNAPIPTLIYHVPGQGTCISVAQDDDLIHWKELPQNPVIPMHKEGDEFINFDPAGWYENGKYYALIGNKNTRPGYEGDCTSLFTSTDLVNWNYEGPFYQSKREWTALNEDAACPDFFPISEDKHMLLMHSHRPLRNSTHYYIGTYENERFFPEQYSRMSWLGTQLSGPESLIDDKGRNIFFGWIAESRKGGESLWGYESEVIPGENDLFAWGSVMSLPRVMTLRKDGRLGIEPAPEFKTLRYNHNKLSSIEISDSYNVNLDHISGDDIELFVEFEVGNTNEVGVKVRCSPDNSEQTLISYLAEEQVLRVDFSNATVLDNVSYINDATYQEAPFQLDDGETLQLRIFIDKSVLEIYANGRQSLTQRIYPSKPESQGIHLFSKGGSAKAIKVESWNIHPTSPW